MTFKSFTPGCLISIASVHHCNLGCILYIQRRSTALLILGCYFNLHSTSQATPNVARDVMGQWATRRHVSTLTTSSTSQLLRLMLCWSRDAICLRNEKRRRSSLILRYLWFERCEQVNHQWQGVRNRQGMWSKYCSTNEIKNWEGKVGNFSLFPGIFALTNVMVAGHLVPPFVPYDVINSKKMATSTPRRNFWVGVATIHS
jgi:hypothetical protein